MVTKEDFEAYEGVRRSGMVNMFDPMARELAGLDKKRGTPPHEVGGYFWAG